MVALFAHTRGKGQYRTPVLPIPVIEAGSGVVFTLGCLLFLLADGDGGWSSVRKNIIKFRPPCNGRWLRFHSVDFPSRIGVLHGFLGSTTPPTNYYKGLGVGNPGSNEGACDGRQTRGLDHLLVCTDPKNRKLDPGQTMRTNFSINILKMNHQVHEYQSFVWLIFLLLFLRINI